MLTTEAVKARAREVGYDLCGIAPAAGFPELQFLEEWLARGYAGRMGYMPRTAERRQDVIGPHRAHLAGWTGQCDDQPAIGALDDAVAVLEGRSGTTLIERSLIAVW